VIRFIY